MSEYVELRMLPIGARFRFYGIPEQTATLVEKGTGRALIRPDRQRTNETREFVARDPKSGERVKKRITVDRGDALEPCALGAQVVPL